MAEALLPAPVYDQRYASIIDILPTAKHIQSFYETVSSYRGTITLDQSLEWGFFVQFVNGTISQFDPVFFIYPSSTSSMAVRTGSDMNIMDVSITISGSSSIIINGLHNGSMSGLIVFM